MTTFFVAYKTSYTTKIHFALGNARNGWERISDHTSFARAVEILNNRRAEFSTGASLAVFASDNFTTPVYPK